MKDRVRELRRRLAPVLEVVSASARRDIEELFELASRPDDESGRLLREVRIALDLVERATGVTTEARPKKRPQQLERESRPKPPRGRGQPAIAPGQSATPEALAPPAPAKGAERDRPTLLERLRAVLAREQRPLSPTEIAAHLLASGWTTRSLRPRNVISAALGKHTEFEHEYGKYRLAGTQPDTAPGPTPSHLRAPRTDLPLGVRIHSILIGRGSAMTYDEIIGELEHEGWPSKSAHKRVLVANAVRKHVGLELVLPGVVWVRGTGAVEEPQPSSPPAEIETPVTAPPQEPLADPGELSQDLAFLRGHIHDARDDTAVLAPEYASRQLSAWAARARSIAERARGRADIADQCGTILHELGALQRLWSLGRRPPALTSWASPREALAAHAKDENGADPSWARVADRLDAQLESAYDDPTFDDGWSDTRWLADDERFATPYLDRTEALLSRIGARIGESPGSTAALTLGPKEVRELVEAARGLRWIRGVAIDGTRWGRCVGRLRWIAQKHPAAAKSKLAEALAPEFHPAGAGWGFDDDAWEARRSWLTHELALSTERALGGWLEGAVEVFDDSEIAGLLLGRAGDLARIDLLRFESRRVRARVAKLMDAMGLAEPRSGVPLPDLGEEPLRTVRFPLLRLALEERFPQRRALMLCNRSDTSIERRLSSALGIEIQCHVATPGRAEAAAAVVRAGNHEVVLSASGFHTREMDDTFARAAREAGLLFVRVNRGRAASCARALARTLRETYVDVRSKRGSHDSPREADLVG